MSVWFVMKASGWTAPSPPATARFLLPPSIYPARLPVQRRARKNRHVGKTNEVLARQEPVHARDCAKLPCMAITALQWRSVGFTEPHFFTGQLFQDACFEWTQLLHLPLGSKVCHPCFLPLGHNPLRFNFLRPAWHRQLKKAEFYSQARDHRRSIDAQIISNIMEPDSRGRREVPSNWGNDFRYFAE
jgi:hypothetical protein